MNRNRLLVLSSLAVVASGALIFACSSGDDFGDSGTDGSAKDAKADGTTQDAKADGTLFGDSGKDAGSDATSNDATTDDGGDATTVDAADDADDGSTVTDGGATDGAITDASNDGGTVATFMVLRVGGSSDPDAGADAALSSGATQGVHRGAQHQRRITRARDRAPDER